MYQSNMEELLARKMQRLICLLFALNIFQIICGIILAALTTNWSAWSIGIPVFVFIFLFFGFYGAKTLNNGFILVYLFFITFMIVIQLIGLILIFILLGFLLGTCLNEYYYDTACVDYENVNIGASIAIIFIQVINIIMIWVVELLSFIAGFKVRRLLLNRNYYFPIQSQQPIPSYISVSPAYSTPSYEGQMQPPPSYQGQMQPSLSYQGQMQPPPSYQG